ncbi:hypothetical protein [Pseudoxanthomonas sp. PXM04]|uniref:hypothetical protein n=1 Tax=Pseudoxanthomonas sp. PXM04 TaxID=2769297 RepID=UPI0017827AFB|nr:hypothetical protein [Pseudoxanthomonas sp. PXM04]MBD9376991.1 hypothetical protein [Pseudoxanthomonas sp. PXM04]
MKAWILLPLWLLTAQAVAQQASPQPVRTESLTAYHGGGQSRQLQEQSGPVTVRWGQPEALPNAADYRVTVTDLDRNGDGVVSRDEVPEGHALASEFKLVDRNHDGRISAEELAAWR